MNVWFCWLCISKYATQQLYTPQTIYYYYSYYLTSFFLILSFHDPKIWKTLYIQWYICINIKKGVTNYMYKDTNWIYWSFGIRVSKCDVSEKCTIRRYYMDNLINPLIFHMRKDISMWVWVVWVLFLKFLLN